MNINSIPIDESKHSRNDSNDSNNNTAPTAVSSHEITGVARAENPGFDRRDPPTTSSLSETATSGPAMSTMEDTIAIRTVPIGERVVKTTSNQSIVCDIEHGTLVTALPIDERTEQEEAVGDNTNHQDRSTLSGNIMAIRTWSNEDRGGVVPTLPTGEVVDAKNTVQSHSILAAYVNRINAIPPTQRPYRPPGDVGHEEWNLELPPLTPSSANEHYTPTDNAINGVGVGAYNDMFVQAAAITTPMPGEHINSNTSTCKKGLCILLILIAVSLGSVVPLLCLSNSCLSSSPWSVSRNASPLPTPLTNNHIKHPTNNPTCAPSSQPTTETNLPTPGLDARTAQILAYMNNVTLSGRNISGPYDVDRAGHILEQSLHWLIYDDPLQLSPDTQANQFRMRQRYALRTLWVQRTADGWIDGSGWNISSVNECKWYGISCISIWLGSDIGQQEAVATINLSSVSLNGVLPADLGLLSSLTYFDLSVNQLHGTLPNSIGNWKSVTTVVLNDNQFTGSLPASIGNWESVEYVDFSNNLLAGSLPNSIGNWQSVTVVDISDNNLTGSLPTTIGNWQRVTYMDLFNNQLVGSLPTSIGNWQSVDVVALWSNQLTGSLPASIGNWQDVTFVALASNKLTGMFPNSIGMNWTNLERAYFHTNLFTGNVPVNWCQLTSLDTLEADCYEEVICNCCTACN